MTDIFSSTAAVVGFEEANYTVNETDATAEVCILVFNPPADEALAFNINLEAATREGTAGKLMIPVGEYLNYILIFSRHF